MQKRVYILIASIAGIALLLLVFMRQQTSPKEETNADAQTNSIAEERSHSRPPYALEKTVRTLNIIEKLQGEASDADQLLITLASVDTNRVADDVIKFRDEFIPIISEFKNLAGETRESEALWNQLKNNVLIPAGPELAAAAYTFAASGGAASWKSLELAAHGAEDALIALAENDAESKKIAANFRASRERYIAFLSEHSGTIHKYHKLWDQLCNHMDAACLSFQRVRFREAKSAIEKMAEDFPDEWETQIFFALITLHANEPRLADNRELKLGGSELVGSDQVRAMLESLLTEYPERSAAANLLLGYEKEISGDFEGALGHYDLSSVQYPKQAAQLTDAFLSYTRRSELRKTKESSFILQFYKSMMEGYGHFSPNLRKASIHQRTGELNMAHEEIKRHFFRRGSQVVRDYLISDLSFCETTLNECFSKMFREHSFVDLECKPSMLRIGNTLNYTVRNRTDLALENVRLFLCIHFTDMFHDEYEVFKINETRARLDAGDAWEGNFDLDYTYDGKKTSVYEDIIRIRGIVITDHHIAYVDTPEVKLAEAKAIYQKELTSHENTNAGDELLRKLTGYGRNELAKAIENTITVEHDDGLLNDTITIVLPRMLAILEPVVSVGEGGPENNSLPRMVSVKGGGIKLEFSGDYPAGNVVPFSITTKYSVLNYYLRLSEDGTGKLYEKK